MTALIKISLLFWIIFFTSACINLSQAEKESARELKGYGIKMNARQIKHPVKAGTLNLVLGFGSFYLSHETQEKSQWMYGLFNLLLYPASVIWGVPQAAIDANRMNTRETIYYYTKNPEGIAELRKVKALKGEILRAVLLQK